MNSLKLAVLASVAFASSAFAQYRFDAATGECRNAAGEQGLNVARGPCADLRGANLEGARFEAMDLRGARFDGARLRGASFLQAELAGASFKGADLSKATLRGARLARANFAQAQLSGAHLEYARLEGAVLTDADLRNASLYKARFEGADVRGARFSQDRVLVDDAHWRGAIADVRTLPFTAAELASRHVTLDQVASR